MKKIEKDSKEVGKTGHIYDGIEELDHATPNWFMALFYGTIIFGVIYFVYFGLGEGPTLLEEYNQSKDQEEIAQFERMAKEGGGKSLSEVELTALVKDPSKKTLGAATFQSKCASCHGAQGQGGIGPNLTDAYWLHGGKMTEILSTISRGVPDKGMPPWGPMLSTDEVQSVTVYIRSISGTKPSDGKAPQGVLVQTEM